MIERSGETPTVPRRGGSVATKLLRIAKKARREPKFQFTSLVHLMNVELLRGCLAELRKDAAAGIDGVTKAMYTEGLEECLTELVERLQRLSYIPEPVRRRYIPKPGTGKQRPLVVDGERNRDAAWYYLEPKEKAVQIRDHVAFWKGVEIVP